MDSSPAETLNIRLTVHGQPLEMSIGVSDRPATPSELLPMARALSDELIRRSAAVEETGGRHVSCKPHCGACCRQLVPASPVEAHAIAELVEQMPEPRRSIILDRFREVRARLEKTDLLAPLLDSSELSPDTSLREIGLAYFAMWLACPFLENESCSIYEDRPVACREYLVTSPAENCKSPNALNIDMVPMAAKVSHALMGIDLESAVAANRKYVDWAPLSLAVDWCQMHPPASSPRPRKALLKRFFELLLQKKIS